VKSGFGYHTITKLFSKKTSEKIEIRLKDSTKPILVLKPMDWDRSINTNKK